MTGIEVCSRVVTAIMALAVVANTMRLWERIGGRRAGVAAGVIVAANATLVYYAHTGNLEIPYMFSDRAGLVEIDRVASDEPRERQALLLAIASVLTKDQAAAAWLLPLPVYSSSSRASPTARRRSGEASSGRPCSRWPSMPSSPEPRRTRWFRPSRTR